MKNDKIFFFIQSILKYNCFSYGIAARSFFYKYFFKKFGKNIQIKDGVTIKYPSEIEIGDNCIIGEFCYLVGKGGLYIGKNVLMGAGTKIITSSHNINNINVLIRNQGLSFNKIIIKDNVFFGFNVIVLGGSYIEKGCVIGALSLINKDFKQANKVIVGIPGKIIKNR